MFENPKKADGSLFFPPGFVVFATTECGDAYALDAHSTPDGRRPVVLFSRQLIEEGDSLEQLIPHRLEVADSLSDFLVKFASGTLPAAPPG
mgnify:CR=1 FL=1